jgi:hypothetical protein
VEIVRVAMILDARSDLARESIMPKSEYLTLRRKFLISRRVNIFEMLSLTYRHVRRLGQTIGFLICGAAFLMLVVQHASRPANRFGCVPEVAFRFEECIYRSFPKGQPIGGLISYLGSLGFVQKPSSIPGYVDFSWHDSDPFKFNTSFSGNELHDKVHFDQDGLIITQTIWSF